MSVGWSWNQIWGWYCHIGDEVDNFEADGDADMGDGDTEDAEDEYYKQVEQWRATKLSAKAEMYSVGFVFLSPWGKPIK